MQIRLAIPSDLTAVVACEKLAFNLTASGADSGDLNSDSKLACQITEGSIHLIFDVTGILGYIAFSKSYDHLFVGAIAVLPKHHRRGLGSQMLAFAEKEAIRLGLRSVRLFTDGNTAGNLMFYERNGYRETGRCEEDTFCRVYLRKTLAPRIGCMNTQ